MESCPAAQSRGKPRAAKACSTIEHRYPTMAGARERAGQGFLQSPPVISNQYSQDEVLVTMLRRMAERAGRGDSWQSSVEPDLRRFGARVAQELHPMSRRMDIDRPRVQRFDAFGREVNRLITCQEWRKMHAVSAEEGLIHLGYAGGRAKHGALARLVQFAKLHLFSANSGMYGCPLAMTDGAAKLTESLLNSKGQKRNRAPLDSTAASLVRTAHERLTTTDPNRFWTSGQWMTERGGGSDVANGTRTYAIPASGSKYKLYGYKWFSSATDANMAVALARERKSASGGQSSAGNRDISCFLVRMPNGDAKPSSNEPPRVRIVRLKDKLGTRQLPTAELELNGAEAVRLSRRGRGISMISSLINVTRLHNAVAATSAVAKLTLFARDYATKRWAFGTRLCDNPLHLETLASLRTLHRAGLAITLDAVELLGRSEVPLQSNAQTTRPSPTQDALLLRILTPLAKLFTAKLAVSCASECLECFGGAGYLEDSACGIPTTYRDVQVLPIWEGTSNVQSQDVLRVLRQTRGRAMSVFAAAVQQKLDEAAGGRRVQVRLLGPARRALRKALASVRGFVGRGADTTRARDLAMALAKIYAGSTLVEHAVWSRRPEDALAAYKFAVGGLQDGGGGLGPSTATRLSMLSQNAPLSVLRMLALGNQNVSPKAKQARAKL